MATSSPRLKYGAIPKGRDFPEQYWRYGAQVGATSLLRYIPAGGGGFARPYPAGDLLKADGYWRWHHPWTHRRRVLLQTGVARTISVVCICTTDLAPRPTIRLLANAALGISEQSATMPAGPNTERTLTLTVTAGASGVAWLQLEWLAMPSGKDQQDWVGWKTLGAS